jgi:hypothetical protein
MEKLLFANFQCEKHLLAKLSTPFIAVPAFLGSLIASSLGLHFAEQPDFRVAS